MRYADSTVFLVLGVIGLGLGWTAWAWGLAFTFAAMSMLGEWPDAK